MEAIHNRYEETWLRTRADLHTIARTLMAGELSQLALPEQEVQTLVESVAKSVPAGNVPAMILNGLARLPERKLPAKMARRDVNLLFKGVEMTLDKAVYGTFFAGPAAILWGYQNLLKLAGYNPEDAFPEGLWQFYVDYALREDTARHANETHGFDTLLSQNKLRLSHIDRMTAWVMASIQCLHLYHALLENEWRERVSIRILRDIAREYHPEPEAFRDLFRRWELERPYQVGREAPDGTSFPSYRRERFYRFLSLALEQLSETARNQWREAFEKAYREDLPGYVRQMSILSYLNPGKYGEDRHPLSLPLVHVGVIYRNHYYLIPACRPGTDLPPDLATVRVQLATMVENPASFPPAHLVDLARVRRSSVYGLRNNLSADLKDGVEALRLAPILLNFDQRSRQLPLAEIRQGERGVGDHALTVFDTGRTFVFDQSHIFFDGAWGAAFSEILTNEALAWARYLHDLPPAQPGGQYPFLPYLVMAQDEAQFIQKSPQVLPEASAESNAVNLKSMLTLRQLFKERSDLLELTVNDLMVLYRAIHMATYQPDKNLVRKLETLQKEPRNALAATAALETIYQNNAVNPTVLIPIDASQNKPANRVVPLSFEVPLNELDLVALHEQTIGALTSYGISLENREASHEQFKTSQRQYLANLAAFGKILYRAKKNAAQGSSQSVETIKLLAHLPTAVQRFLDQVPDRFEVLNDLIKGREVFSNIGAVARSSTLSRFITAKDDNEKKTLMWGIISDASQNMFISLRDFRPHVALLQAAGEHELTNQIAQDYLDAYAKGLNAFIRDLRAIVLGRPITFNLETTSGVAAHDTRLADVINAYARNGKLVPADEVLQIGWGIADLLDEAHQNQTVYGNLSPASISLTAEDEVVIDAADSGPITPYYIAPEQTQGNTVPQSDVYALGVILYQMMTGIVPFDHPSRDGLMFQHQTFSPPNPRSMNPRIGKATANAMLNALRKSPQKRYSSAGAFLREFEAALLAERAGQEPVFELPPMPAGRVIVDHSMITR